MNDVTLRGDGHVEGGVSIRTKMRVATLIVNVSAVMEGTMENWPNNIQDGVYEALERLCKRRRGDFKIVMSYSDKDIDTGPYIHVVAACLETLQ